MRPPDQVRNSSCDGELPEVRRAKHIVASLLAVLLLALIASAQDAQVLEIENIVQAAKGGTAAWIPAANIKDRAALQELSMSGNWNSPSGFFATVEANAFLQDLNDDPNGFVSGTAPRHGDSFWQFNALVGYRFWRNQGAVTLGVLNIGDTDYQLSPLRRNRP